MKVYFPERIVERHVGGNTTYGRHLRDGLKKRGLDVGLIPAGGTPAVTALRETTFGLRYHPPGSVLHYLADTGPLMGSRAPSVVTVHGVASRWISTARTPRQERIWRLRVRSAIAASDRVITVSESSRRDVASEFGVAEDQITVIHHGVDLPSSSKRALSPAVAQAVPSKYLLYVGNIEPRKNLVALVDAMNRPELRQLGLRLVIAGKPAWNAEESLRAITASPHVIHLGFVSDEDRSALMAGALAFVFPSLYEGFGFPVLEAMAAGTPTLCSNAGSLAEVAGPAWRLEDITADGIAEGVARALQSAAWMAEIPSRGPEWASEFSWAKSIAQHIAVYREVVGR